MRAAAPQAPEHDPQRYREMWDRKPGLRAVYSDMYRKMLDRCVPGLALEIGGGSGNLKAFAPQSVTTDIVSAPWLDVVCDAQRLPFATGQFGNVLMFDVLHHIEFPIRALQEFERVLRPGGVIVMCEPAITPVSSLFYRAFHPEPVIMSADPLQDGSPSPDRNPFDSNQAIPTLLVGRLRERAAEMLPNLELLHVERFAFLAYPLTGGFRPWSLLPAGAAGPLLRAEWCVRHWLGPLAAFRLLAVYRKRV